MLTGKTIIVTGAAGGIGKASVAHFVELGAQILAVDIHPDVLALEDMRSDAGGRVKSLRADLCQEEEVAQMVRTAVAQFGRLDGAFNNAGVDQAPAPLAEIGLSAWQQVIALNLTGVFLCLKYQLEQMVQQGQGGTIVNTSSVLGQVAIQGNAAYTASKHGVIGLTRAAAVEYAAHRIRVNALLPGAVATPMFMHAMQDPVMATQLEAVKAAHPLGRMSEPREMADVAAWLLSEQSSYVTGASIVADGGYTAQ